ncbi:hypothetical protein [Streptomyces sp. NRRL F-5755]|uniref:hypothetical protein n=1 Tax=Streptomyces sp. NRRL F-5755 TaxID=1519475 RepID=UPI001331A740|nr:hypothetical protein [Streptomyces sp. NRRL F-5755]
MQPAPQAGVPYGQHPPAPGYAGGWNGMPPIPPPPRKSNTGKVLGIVGGVVGIVVVGSIVAVMTSGAADSGPKYKTTVPKTLVGGEYTLTKDLSSTANAQVPHNGSYARNMTTVGGQYAAGSKALVMLSMYGSISDPQEAVKQTIHGMQSGGAELAVPKSEERPNGTKEPVYCGVLVKSQMGQKLTVPFCTWADASTSGNVLETDAERLSPDPFSVDLEALAKKTDQIRREIRVPIGQ